MKCSASYILKARITQLGRGRVLLAPDKPKTSSWLESCPKGFPTCARSCVLSLRISHFYFCCPHHAASLFFLGVWERRGKELDSEHLPSKLPDFTSPESDFEPLTSKLPDLIYQKSENDGQQIMLRTFQVCTFIKHESNP